MRLSESDLADFARKSLDSSHRRIAGPFAALFPIAVVDEPTDEKSMVLGEYTQVMHFKGEAPRFFAEIHDDDYNARARECVDQLVYRACNRTFLSIAGSLLGGDVRRVGPGEIGDAAGALIVGGADSIARFKVARPDAAGCEFAEFGGGCFGDPAGSDRGLNGSPGPAGAPSRGPLEFRTFLPAGVLIRVAGHEDGPIGRLSLQRNASNIDNSRGFRVAVKASKDGDRPANHFRAIDDIFFMVNARVYIDHPDRVSVVEVG
jgi:hypothetical protein